MWPGAGPLPEGGGRPERWHQPDRGSASDRTGHARRGASAMYRRIVVPLDGSALGERALPHAEAIAERFGAALTLLHATTPPSTIAAAAAAARLIPNPPAPPHPGAGPTR